MAPAEIVKPSVNEGIVFPEAESGVALASRPVDSLVLYVKGDALDVSIDNSAFFGGRSEYHIPAGNSPTLVTPSVEGITDDPYGGDTQVTKFVAASSQRYQLEMPPWGQDVGTFMAWVYRNSLGQILFADANPANNSAIGFGTTAIDNLLMSMVNPWDDDTGSTISFAGTVGSGSWIHILFSWNRTAGRQSLYTDGTRVDQDAPSTGGQEITNMVIGSGTGAANPYDGYMADTRFHDIEIGGGDTPITVPTGYLT